MARTQKAELLLESDQPESVYEVAENGPDEQTAHDDALDDFLNNSRAAGGDAEIIVRRVQDTGNPNSVTSYCGKFPVDKYDYFTLQDVIKNKWGGGDYRLFCMGIKNGKRRIIQNQLITVESELVAAKSENSEVVALLREVLNRQAPAPAPNVGSMLSQITELTTVMNALRPPERNPMKDFMETLAMMKTLGFMPGEMSDVEEINPIWGTLAQALPSLINGAMQRQNAPVMRKNPAQRKPSPQQPTPQKQTEKPDMISYYLSQLETYAKNKTDSEMVADTIADKAPDFDALMEIVSGDDFIPKYTASGFWAKSDYREWLIDVREWLLAHAELPSKYSANFESADIPNDGDYIVNAGNENNGVENGE